MLIIFEMISLKQMKLLTNFSWLEKTFMPKLYLTQRGFTYSACGPPTKHYEKIQKFKEAGDFKYICKTN